MFKAHLTKHYFRSSGILLLAFFLLSSLHAFGGEKSRGVDSGTFGVFVRGQRVASETFQIQQTSIGSTTTSEFKAQMSGGKAANKSEMQITSTGDLRRYEWRETNPGKAHILVEPSEDILIEHITPNPPDQRMEQPFMLPRSTVILDDYFFSHREVLAWRYLAQACNGTLQNCKPGRLQYGVLVPQQRASIMVTMEYGGLEKVAIRGSERELNRLNLKGEGMDWALYLDSDLKLVKIAIPAEQTEVVRD